MTGAGRGTETARQRAYEDPDLADTVPLGPPADSGSVDTSSLLLDQPFGVRLVTDAC